MTISAADHDDPTKATITDVATLIATGAGVGLSPVAPGTAGSIVAAALLAFFSDMPVIWHWWGWFGLIAKFQSKLLCPKQYELESNRFRKRYFLSSKYLC